MSVKSDADWTGPQVCVLREDSATGAATRPQDLDPDSVMAGIHPAEVPLSKNHWMSTSCKGPSLTSDLSGVRLD